MVVLRWWAWRISLVTFGSRLSPGESARAAERQVLLLTTRDTHRWMIPKGWPIKGRKPAEVASQEAYGEAGLIGHIVSKRPLGVFHYEKQLTHESRLCQVRVFSRSGLIPNSMIGLRSNRERPNGLTRRRLPRWSRRQPVRNNYCFAGSYVRFVSFRKERYSKKRRHLSHPPPATE